MDGLALLCNLFADGPVTLRRLRPHVKDLATLEHVPAQDLAGWIQCSVPQARAFAEEAAILRHRIGEEAVVEEPEPGPLLVGFAGFGTRPVEEPIEDLPELPVLESGAHAPGAVLVPARERDEEGDAGRTLLRAGLLPGLDVRSCTRLGDCGVRTVRALAEGAGLALSRRTEIPYSRLLGLARAARCFLRGEDPAPTREPVLEIRPVAPPAPPEAEAPVQAPARSLERAHDPFALPAVEPESAGPFG